MKWLTDQMVKKLRQDLAQLEKRAAKLEKAQTDASISAVVATLRDIAKAIRECGGGGYTEAQLMPVLVAVDDILNRLKIVDAAVGGKGNKP